MISWLLVLYIHSFNSNGLGLAVSQIGPFDTQAACVAAEAAVTKSIGGDVNSHLCVATSLGKP